MSYLQPDYDYDPLSMMTNPVDRDEPTPSKIYQSKNDLIQAIKQFADEGEFNKNSNVVVIFPDHGSRYMSKIYSDEWMSEQGFFDSVNSEESQKIEIIK